MVTPDEIGEIRIFTCLDGTERDHLARAAADLTLGPGEYAVQEGAERALFGVLSGRIEVVRYIDGIERILGVRGPGDVFGEVPLTLGSLFPVGFRATEPTRLMRVEPHDYYSVAAAAPQVAQQVGKLAAERIGGLQEFAAEEQPPRAVIVGHRWDGFCGDLRRFLDRNQLSFEWIAEDDPDAAERWGGPLPPDAELPTVRVVDGPTLTCPDLRTVAEALNLQTRPGASEYDVVIVGAGPAGLAAAVYGASEGLSTVVVEREAPGGQAGTSSRIENYLGFPGGVSGDELASRALNQAKRLGAEILVTRSIEGVDTEERDLLLDGGDRLRAHTIILACGVAWRRLDTEGFERLEGKGVFYGASRSEAPGTHGLDVHVVGAGNSAGQSAMFFSAHARSVTILCRGDGLEKSMSRYLIDQIAGRPNIRVLTRTEVTAAHGENAIEAIDVRNADTGETEALKSGGLFLFIGADAETRWLPEEIALDPKGFVLTGTSVTAADRWALDRDPYLLETSVPGIFACGDVRLGPVKRVAAAVGEGSMAIAFIHQYLREAAATTAG